MFLGVEGFHTVCTCMCVGKGPIVALRLISGMKLNRVLLPGIAMAY